MIAIPVDTETIQTDSFHVVSAKVGIVGKVRRMINCGTE